MVTPKMIIYLSILMSVSCFKEWWADSHSVDLNRNNFYDYVGLNKYVIVKFYTKWCTCCKQMAPQLEQFEIWAEENRKDVVFGRVDADLFPELAQYYQINLYPKTLIFQPGQTQPVSNVIGYKTFDEFKLWLSAYPPIIKKKEPEITNSLVLQNEVKTGDGNELITKKIFDESMMALKSELNFLVEKLESTKIQIKQIKNLKNTI
jgi:thiol-disulfide isomerase/thioredoxin